MKKIQRILVALIAFNMTISLVAAHEQTPTSRRQHEAMIAAFYEQEVLDLEFTLNEDGLNLDPAEDGDDTSLEEEPETPDIPEESELDEGEEQEAPDLTYFEELGILIPNDEGFYLNPNPEGLPAHVRADLATLTWEGLRTAVNCAPPTGGGIPGGCPVGSGRPTNNATATVITLTGHMPINTAGSVILINDGRNVTINSTGTNHFSITQDAPGRHFQLNHSRLTLDRVTLTRISTVNGGGIEIFNASTVTLDGGTIIENAVNMGHLGGAIDVRHENSYLHINDARIINNRATAGGAASAQIGAYIVMNGGEISGNTATTTGGAIVTTSPEVSGDPRCAANGTNCRPPGRDSAFIMYDGVITNNTTSLDGGGIRAGIESRIEMHGGTIEGNRALRRGGGLEITEDSTFVWTGGSIRNNGRNASGAIVTPHGGGLSIMGGGRVEMTGANAKILEDNASLDGGGGIYMNTAGFGGGWVSDFRITRTAELYQAQNANVIIRNNHTNGNGGGIFARNNEILQFGIPVTHPTVLTLRDGIVIHDNTANQNGGGVNLYSASNHEDGVQLLIRGGNIRNNTAHSGAGVFVTDAYMDQSGGHIHHNRGIATPGNIAGASRGGGVALTGTSTFDMTSGEIRNNYTHGQELQNGGGNGVWMGDETTFNMSGDARIHTNGRTSAGPNVVGGIFLLNSATLNMSGDAQLVDNWGEGSGGGIRARNNAMVNLSGNATVARNRTTNLQAGGIMIENNATLDMSDNALVYDNTAVQNAGGVELRNTAAMTMSDHARIAGNRAGLHGGGMRMLDTSRLTMSDNALIEGNLAGMTGTGNGGGLHVAGNALAENASRVVISDDATIRNNRAHNGGGIHWNTAGVLHVTGGHIYGHTRQSVNDVPIVHGGGINAVNGTLNLSGGTIRENHAVEGGGIRITVGTLNVSNGYIRNNTAHSGAGVHVDNATMTQSGGHIHHNQGIATPGNIAGMSRGGGVALTGTSMFNMTSGEIRNNDTLGTVEVDRGGSGVWMGDETTFNMSGDARIHTNGRNLTTANAVGGVFALNNATFNMSDDAQITNNVTNSSGAGIRARNAARVNLSDNATVSGNRTNLNGGGILIENTATLSMLDNAFVHGNTANQSGGGIQMSNGTFNFYGGTIGHENPDDGNTAGTNGGGIHLGSGTVNFRGSDTINILGNTATTGNGGGINWVGGAINTIANTGDVNITDNAAGNNGGGIFQGTGTLTMTTDWAISGNTANGTVTDDSINRGGGGVYVTQAATFNATGGQVTNNQAPNGDGGGIFTERHNYVPTFPTPAENYSINYTNLNIDGSVAFTGNSARKSSLQPNNPEVLTWLDFTGSSTSSLVGNSTNQAAVRHWLNNYDINYIREPIDFEFTKTDDEGRALPGAQFSLFSLNEAGDRITPPSTTTSAGLTAERPGLVSFSGLQPGRSYHLVEIAAPDGFITPTGYWLITVSATGEITIEARDGAPMFTMGVITSVSEVHLNEMFEEGLDLSENDDEGIESTMLTPVSHIPVTLRDGTTPWPHATIFSETLPNSGTMPYVSVDMAVIHANITEGWEIVARGLGYQFFSISTGELISSSALNYVSGVTSGEARLPLTGGLTDYFWNGTPAMHFVIMPIGEEPTEPIEPTLILRNERVPTTASFNFIKTDDVHEPHLAQPLPGATFRIYACSENNVCTDFRYEATSDANGVVSLGNLLRGSTHRLVESEAPTGFVTPAAGHYWVIDVAEDGTVTVTRAQNAPNFSLDDDDVYHVGNQRPLAPITGLGSHLGYIALLVISLLGMVACIGAYVQKLKRSRS